MVRTLVFHSKNAGSNPASLKINSMKYWRIIKPYNDKQVLIRYKFSFISLISPFMAGSDKSLLFLTKNPLKKESSKQYFRNSYIMFTWFFYISKHATPTGGVKTRSTKNKFKHMRLAVLPVTRQVITLSRAPMAHKDNSKEQFEFIKYKFSFSFKAIVFDFFFITSINLGLFLFLDFKKSFPLFETNFLFLKSYSIKLSLWDLNFFNLNKF